MFELDPKPPILHQFLVIRINGERVALSRARGLKETPKRLDAAQRRGRPETPNARRHWRDIAHEAALWKAVAEQAASDARREWEAKHGLAWRPVTRAVVSVAFGLPDRRTRDLDNLIASCKPLLDGIVAAGALVDDSITVIQKIEFGAVVNGTAETIFTVDEILPGDER